MATKPSWLTANPSSGSGNGTISNSASAHTGRVARTGTVTVTGVGISAPKTYAVTQSPLAEFVNFTDGAEMAVAKTGGKVTITGKSNSSKLAFAWVIPAGSTEPEVDDDGNVSNNGVNFPSVEIPATFTANGADASNGEAITGDPGATSQYAWSIDFQIPANNAMVGVNRTLKVTAAGSQAAQIVIKQSAGESSLSVSPTAIAIPQSGTAVSVQVTSNTSWTIS